MVICSWSKRVESYYARENLEKQKLFFEYYLKKRTTIGKILTVTYEVREKFYQGHYREASDFPIPNTQYTALYLDGEAFPQFR